MLRSIPRIRQHDIRDCGAACLASVARHYSLTLPLARVRQYASTDRRGTNMLGMVEAAEALGFVAKAVRASPEALDKVPLPAVAHVVRGPLQHYVVLYRAGPKGVTIMDPADGRAHRLSGEEFMAQWTGVLLLLAPGDRFRPGRQGTTVLGRFWAIVRPHRAIMLQVLAGAALYTLLGLSAAVYVQKVVDHVLVDGNRNLLNLLSLAALALLLLQAYLGFMRGVLSLRTGQRIDATLLLGYYQHLLTLPQRFFDTMRVGEVISRVNDAVKIRAFINDVAIDTGVNVLVVAFSFAMIFAYSAELGALMLLFVPAYGAIYCATNRLNRRNLRAVMERGADLEAQLVESLNAIATIKQLGLEGRANLKTEGRFIGLLRSIYRTGLTALGSATACHVAARASTVALFWVGAGLAIERQITPGQLMSCYALLTYLTGPVTSLIGMNRTAQDALIAADRLFEIMDLEREADGDSAARLDLTPDLTGDIEFRDVKFRYGTRTQVFDGLTLRIPKGQVTAVVGESGSGKSTLAALLQRIYPVDGGQIRIGAHDLRYVSLESLRRIIGIVPQRVDLLTGTVVENIAAGDPAPDMQRVLATCQALEIVDMVERLPGGLYAQLEQNGANLSGGERQRIAIARALYRDPEVLVLDEATSSLDSLSEAHIQRVVQELRRAGKTVIVIAHRLSTVAQADKIVVLDRGRVAEQGSHDELRRTSQTYRRLWRHQYNTPELDARPAEPAAVAPGSGPSSGKPSCLLRPPAGPSPG